MGLMGQMGSGRSNILIFIQKMIGKGHFRPYVAFLYIKKCDIKNISKGVSSYNGHFSRKNVHIALISDILLKLSP